MHILIRVFLPLSTREGGAGEAEEKIGRGREGGARGGEQEEQERLEKT